MRLRCPVTYYINNSWIFKSFRFYLLGNGKYSVVFCQGPLTNRRAALASTSPRIISCHLHTIRVRSHQSPTKQLESQLAKNHNKGPAKPIYYNVFFGHKPRPADVTTEGKISYPSASNPTTLHFSRSCKTMYAYHVH